MAEVSGNGVGSKGTNTAAEEDAADDTESKIASVHDQGMSLAFGS